MRRTYLLLLPAALLTACATHAVDENYGKAVAQMQRAQTYNVRTLSTPENDRAVQGMDQIQGMAALASLRKDTADRSVVKAAPLINISQSSSGGGGGSQ